MSALQFFKARPAFAAALTVATVSLVLFFIPFSYERTVGNDVTLTLAGPGLDREAVGAIADEFSASIGSDDVRVSRIEPRFSAITTMHDDHAAAATPTAAMSAAVGEAPSPSLAHPEQFRIKAFTSTRSKQDAQRAATLFASKLAARGIDSRAQVTPRRERVEGNMYAVANESVCQLTIDRNGKTAEELEADIRSQLQASCGMSNPTVDVTMDGDMTQVQISCSQDCCLDGSGNEGAEECELKLMVNGADGVAKPIIIRPHAGMTQEEIQALIEEELRAQGITATPEVHVEHSQTEGGEQQCRVEVKIEKP